MPGYDNNASVPRVSAEQGGQQPPSSPENKSAWQHASEMVDKKFGTPEDRADRMRERFGSDNSIEGNAGRKDAAASGDAGGDFSSNDEAADSLKDDPSLASDSGNGDKGLPEDSKDDKTKDKDKDKGKNGANGKGGDKDTASALDDDPSQKGGDKDDKGLPEDNTSADKKKDGKNDAKGKVQSAAEGAGEKATQGLSERKKKLMQKLAAVQAASKAGILGLKAMMFAAMLKFLLGIINFLIVAVAKSVGWFIMALTWLANAGLWLIKGIAAVGVAVAKAVTGVVVGFAQAMTVGFVTFIVGIATLVSAGAVYVQMHSGPANMARDEALVQNGNPCNEVLSAALLDYLTTLDTDTPDEREQAYKFYSLFKAYGIPDVNIAAILACMWGESRIDVNGVEGNDIRGWNDAKTHAMSDLNDYTIKMLNAIEGDEVTGSYGYAKRGVRQSAATAAIPARESQNGRYVHPSAYLGSDGETYYCGLGLIQWTGPRAERLLNLANSLGIAWNTAELQGLYIMLPTENGGDGNAWIKTWTTPANNTSDACDECMINWLGGGIIQERRDKAAYYMLQIAEWTADLDWANSIIEQAGVDLDLATQDALAAANKDCGISLVSSHAHDSIARAAVAIAWPSRGQSIDNDGTPEYIRVHDMTIGDKVYRSCDRGAAAAIRWAGAGDDFPVYVEGALQYMIESDRWEELPSDYAEEDLEPGDVFIVFQGYEAGAKRHIWIYVGSGAVAEVYPPTESPGNTMTDLVMMSASNTGGQGPGSRSPALLRYHNSTGGVRGRVFRCLRYDENSQWGGLNELDPTMPQPEPAPEPQPAPPPRP